MEAKDWGDVNGEVIDAISKLFRLLTRELASDLKADITRERGDFLHQKSWNCIMSRKMEQVQDWMATLDYRVKVIEARELDRKLRVDRNRKSRAKRIRLMKAKKK